MTNKTQTQAKPEGTQLTAPTQDQVLNQVVGLVQQLLKSLTQAADGQNGGELLTKAMPMLEKLVTQLMQKPAQQNEDNMPGNDNKFMEIDDIVDNLVNAGMITASNFSVNVELFRGSPITVSITKAGEKATAIQKDVDAGDSISEDVDTEEKKAV
jgi:hypothetical protein